jgi:hypothetical protein
VDSSLDENKQIIEGARDQVQPGPKNFFIDVKLSSQFPSAIYTSPVAKLYKITNTHVHV